MDSRRIRYLLWIGLARAIRAIRKRLFGGGSRG